uniref:Secreted protein n=1 Tax=Tetraselmis sp. GSL018 TaxID=582737 RepID=A0A061RNQ1_9CHLO
MPSFRMILVVLHLFFGAPSVFSRNEEINGSVNIYGEELHKCDRSTVKDARFPTTGFLRDNRCTATAEDAGSHFVCVNLPSAINSKGEIYSPFWTVTGQAFSPETATRWPLPGPWCICEWAYARMLQSHDEFRNYLNCPAIHAWVIDSYRPEVPNQLAALRSVCEHCDVINKGKLNSLVEKCRQVVSVSAY